jgi:hypothetical protein
LAQKKHKKEEQMLKEKLMLAKKKEMGGMDEGLEEQSSMDSYEDEDMEEEAPKQTMELAQELFNPDALKTFLKRPQFLGIPNTIYGPYSQFCCHVPFEMFFSYETIN